MEDRGDFTELGVAHPLINDLQSSNSIHIFEVIFTVFFCVFCK